MCVDQLYKTTNRNNSRLSGNKRVVFTVNVIDALPKWIPWLIYLESNIVVKMIQFEHLDVIIQLHVGDTNSSCDLNHACFWNYNVPG